MMLLSRTANSMNEFHARLLSESSFLLMGRYSYQVRTDTQFYFETDNDSLVILATMGIGSGMLGNGETHIPIRGWK